jgi:hypothetical protein
MTHDINGIAVPEAPGVTLDYPVTHPVGSAVGTVNITITPDAE